MDRASLFFALAALLALGHAPAARGGTILFLVAKNPALIDPCVLCDSFVLPLSDPADVEAARDIIEVGGATEAFIATAQIAAGADGINRDLLAPGQPAWSWHVTEFEAFVGSTIELVDGNPTLVEADVAGWIDNTDGAIGFWTYTVVQELPEASGPALLAVGAAVLALARRFRRRPA
jgi:hypothetical protein